MGSLFDTPVNPDLNEYDRFLVMFSGGKDSLACILELIGRGAPKDRIELWHHDVDGGDPFMDWPVTADYCRKVAAALGIPIRFSYREGGFRREMLRAGDSTAPVIFETPDGRTAAGGRGPEGTRRKFPQVSANLSVRWCSAALKIDVADIALKNDIRFRGIKTLVLTGERAEESAARAHYATFEPHRSDLRDGKRYQRHIDHWRPVHAWKEARVWSIINERGIVPHPAYRMGWGRLSCMSCIFGNADQWASVRAVAPERFEEIARYEEEFRTTIHRTLSVRQMADRGTPYEGVDPALVELAMSETYTGPVEVPQEHWTLPLGAFGDSTGPT